MSLYGPFVKQESEMLLWRRNIATAFIKVRDLFVWQMASLACQPLLQKNRERVWSNGSHFLVPTLNIEVANQTAE